MRVALDSNFLLYSAGINDPIRARVAQDILDRLPANDTFVPVQVLGEVFRAIDTRLGRPVAIKFAHEAGYSTGELVFYRTFLGFAAVSAISSASDG